MSGTNRKLWRVDVTKTLFVWADSPDVAESIAFDNVNYESGEVVGPAVLVTLKSQIPNEWYGALAWGDDEDRTCHQLVELSADASEAGDL